MTDEILSKFDKIDIFVNNAGVIEKKRKLTEDGYERTFMINHLSMFLLTLRLIPLLSHDDPSRIINVSSQYFRHVALNVEYISDTPNTVPEPIPEPEPLPPPPPTIEDRLMYLENDVDELKRKVEEYHG